MPPFKEKNFRKAQEYGASIGFTEAEFKRRGGGCFYMYFYWGIALALLWYGAVPPPPPGEVGVRPY